MPVYVVPPIMGAFVGVLVTVAFGPTAGVAVGIVVAVATFVAAAVELDQRQRDESGE